MHCECSNEKKIKIIVQYNDLNDNGNFINL